MSQRSRGEGHKKVHDTQVGTNAGVTATLAAAAGAKNVVTHISGSGDAAGLVTIESPSGTVVWKRRYAAAFNFSENFSFGEYETSDVNVAILVKISTSTSNAEANIAGLQVGA